MGKIKDFINRNKPAIAVATVSSALMVSSAVSAFAVEDPTLKDQLQIQFSSIQGDLLGYAGMVVAIAIPVIAAFYGIRKAVSFFMKLTRKD